MRRTFVYKAPAENRPPPAPNGNSLRKRKRSPESSRHDTVGAKKATGNDDDDASPGGEDDYFDEIGTAAIELYELTQRDPELAVDSTSTASVPRPEETALQTGHEQLLTAKRSVPTTVARANVPLVATTPPTHSVYPPSQQQQQPKPLQAASSTTLISAHSNSRTPLALPPSAGTLPPTTAPAELLDELRELREANYCKDGEVKVLRSEKERLVEELRRKEEASRDVQTRLLVEKEDVEQRYMREKEAMATTLKFSEQELLSLQERCRLLEDKLKRTCTSQQQQQLPTPTKPSAAAAAIKVSPLDSSVGTGGGFMSMEAAALCSQASSALPVISVGMKRPSSMLEPSLNSFKTSSQCHQLKKPPVHTPSSSSSSSFCQPHLSGNGGIIHPLENAMVFRHIKQEEGTTATPITLPATATPTLISQTTPTAPPKEATQVQQVIAMPWPTDGDWDYKPVALDIPDLNGPQLLMLLANPGLNRPPPVVVETTSGPQVTPKGGKLVQRTRTRSHMAGEEEGGGEEETTPLREPWSPESPQKLTGLLSLLHLKTPTSIFPVNTRALSASVLPPTEVRGDHLRPDSLMKKIRHASSVVRRGATEMEPNPVGRFEPDLSGPASRWHALSSPSSNTKGAINPTSEGLGPQTRIDAFEEWNPTKSTSLARGVDPNRLEEHINLILNLADTMATGSSQISTALSFSSPAPTTSPSLSPRRPNLPHQGAAGDMAVSLLPSLGDVLVRYHAEQLLKTRPPLDVTAGQLDVSGGEGAWHLSASTSASSRSSGEEGVVRSEVNHKVLLEAVSALETLVVYSGRVRVTLLAPPPPPFKLESRPSSVIGQASVTALKGGGGGGQGSGDSLPAMAASSTPVGMCVTTPLRAGHCSDTSGEKEFWKGKRLSSMDELIPSISCGVWYEKDGMSRKALLASDTAMERPISLDCGHLLQTLIDLVAPPWKETVDILRPIVKTLCALAEDCPDDLIERFFPLLMSDSVNISLDRDDPHLTLDILRLLSYLCQSPVLVAALTSDHADTCILYTCYHRLVATPPWPRSQIIAVELQTIRLVSAVLMAPRGASVLFEPASNCPCSFELIKALTTLLTNTVDGVSQPSQLSGPLRQLVLEVVRLLHAISQEDPYFDSHRQECQHTYSFSLHRLAWLMAEWPSELEMVKELKEYCEGEEDGMCDSEET